MRWRCRTQLPISHTMDCLLNSPSTHCEHNNKIDLIIYYKTIFETCNIALKKCILLIMYIGIGCL